jgi:hypothetical protein
MELSPAKIRFRRAMARGNAPAVKLALNPETVKRQLTARRPFKESLHLPSIGFFIPKYITKPVPN